MKKIISMIMLIALVFSLAIAGCPKELNAEKNAVKKVVESAYVQGVHIEQNAEKMKRGFHESFNMQILRDNKIRVFPIAKWIKGVEKKSKEKKKSPAPEVTYKLPIIDVTGNAAIVKIELYKDSKHIYSDSMSLYKFKDGWKIVNKIFHSHQYFL